MFGKMVQIVSRIFDHSVADESRGAKQNGEDNRLGSRLSHLNLRDKRIDVSCSQEITMRIGIVDFIFTVRVVCCFCLVRPAFC